MKTAVRISAIIVFATLGCTNGLLNVSSLFGAFSGTADYGTGIDGSYSTVTPVTTATTYVDTLAQTRTFSYTNMISNYDVPTRTILTLASGFTAQNLLVGDEVMWIVMSAGTTSTCTGTRGMYGFAKITALASPIVTIDTALPAGVDPVPLSYASPAHCNVQLVRVPNFTNVTIGGGTGSISPVTYSLASGGGVIAMRVSNSLDFISATAKIDTSSKGYIIPGNYSYPGNAQTEIITVASNSPNGMGGGGGLGINGSAGGAGYGAGGNSGASAAIGGLAISECAGSCPASQRLFFGGTGGQSSNYFTSVSGGIVIIFASNISGVAGAQINASGGGGGSSGGGWATGGSGGGTILVVADSASGIVVMSASGGTGGTAVTAGHTGGGGGGGGQVQMYYCSSSGSLSPSAVGGPGGTGPGGNGFTGSFGYGNISYSNLACP